MYAFLGVEVFFLLVPMKKDFSLNSPGFLLLTDFSSRRKYLLGG